MSPSETQVRFSLKLSSSTAILDAEVTPAMPSITTYEKIGRHGEGPVMNYGSLCNLIVHAFDWQIFRSSPMKNKKHSVHFHKILILVFP